MILAGVGVFSCELKLGQDVIAGVGVAEAAKPGDGMAGETKAIGATGMLLSSKPG